MIYTENIFICLAAPLLIVAFLLKGDSRRHILFLTIGLGVCLLSAYINSFLVSAAAGLDWYSLDAAESAIRLTPVCEEIMKAFPLFVYLALFKPNEKSIVSAAFVIGLGFATLENCSYLIQYGASEVGFVLVRGFSAGIMHTVCAAVMGYGLAFALNRSRLIFVFSIGLLSAATTLHALYNLFVSGSGGWQIAGYVFPAVLALGILFLVKHPYVKYLGSWDKG